MDFDTFFFGFGAGFGFSLTTSTSFIVTVDCFSFSTGSCSERVRADALSSLNTLDRDASSVPSSALSVVWDEVLRASDIFGGDGV